MYSMLVAVVTSTFPNINFVIAAHIGKNHGYFLHYHYHGYLYFIPL